MRLCLFTGFMVVCSFAGFGQNKKEKVNEFDLEKWSEGSIMLDDGTELKGLVRFEDRAGVLNYQNGNDSRSFTPRSVLGFEFFDEELVRQRVFYSIEFENQDDGIKRPVFFELLKDFKTFAVMSKADPVQVSMKANPAYSYGSAGTNSSTEIEQTETIYFMREDGTLEPYVKVQRRVVNHQIFSYAKNTEKIVDKKVMGRYFTKEENDAMEAYAEKNELNIRIKEHLIKILNYCAEQKAQNKG